MAAHWPLISAEAPIDHDRRVGETDDIVERCRSVFLEVTGLVDLGENVMALLSVQGVGLEPLYSSGNAVSSGSCDRGPLSGHQVRDDRVAGKLRLKCAPWFNNGSEG